MIMLGTLIIVCLSSLLVTNAAPENYGNTNGPLDVCRPINTLEKRAKMEIVALISKLISTCGFKMLANNKHTWSKDILLVAPQLTKKLCIMVIVVYNRFSIAPNRISPDLAKNATVVIDTFVRMMDAVAFNYRDEGLSCICVPLKRRVCYSTPAALQLMKEWAACYQTITHGQIPEYAEEVLQIERLSRKKFTSSGLIKYYTG